MVLVKDIIQYEKPRQIYVKPANTFAGWFLGNPGMNFFGNQNVITSNSIYAVKNDIFDLKFKYEKNIKNDEIVLGIRPEDIKVLNKNEPGAIKGTIVKKTIVIGGQYLLKVEIGDAVCGVKCSDSIGFGLEKNVYIKLPANKISFFTLKGERMDCKLSDK